MLMYLDTSKIKLTLDEQSSSKFILVRVVNDIEHDYQCFFQFLLQLLIIYNLLILSSLMFFLLVDIFVGRIK